MESTSEVKKLNIGKKIESVRRLRGFTQDQVAKELGITKQAVSKLEQSENIEEERLSQIANALGVTLDGLKAFREEGIFYNTNNFYEPATFNNSAVAAYIDTSHIHNPIEKIVELYESLLKSEREKVEILQNKKPNT